MLEVVPSTLQAAQQSVATVPAWAQTVSVLSAVGLSIYGAVVAQKRKTATKRATKPRYDNTRPPSARK